MGFLRWVIVGAGIIAVASLGLAAVFQDESSESGKDTETFGSEKDTGVRPPGHAGPYGVDILGGSGGKKCKEINDCYYPPSITVPAGGTVFWSNIDGAPHTVTSGNGDDGHDGMFDSDLIFSGSTFGYVFDRAGAYDYYCILHPWMTGMVTVTGPPGAVQAYKPAEPGPEPAGPLPASATVLLPSGTSVPGCEDAGRCFVPPEIYVARGATVSWANNDSGTHTVTSRAMESGPTEVFDTGLFLPGETFEHTFESAGTFDYYCRVHPWMVGIVSVR